MFDIFGASVSLNELIAIFMLLVTSVGLYYRFDNKVSQIIDRNTLIDRAHDELEKRLLSMEGRTIQEISILRATLDNRISATDNRLQVQDVFLGRLDERLSSMTNQLEKVIDIVQKK